MKVKKIHRAQLMYAGAAADSRMRFLFYFRKEFTRAGCAPDLDEQLTAPEDEQNARGTRDGSPACRQGAAPVKTKAFYAEDQLPLRPISKPFAMPYIASIAG